MINIIVYFSFALLTTTAVFSVCAVIASRIIQGWKHWPALWSYVLVCSGIASATATLLFFVPLLNPADALGISTSHLPLNPVEFTNLKSTWENTKTSTTTAVNPSAYWAACYTAGLLLMLTRLVNGRARAQRIACLASVQRCESGMQYWLYDDDFSPFLISPRFSVGWFFSDHGSRQNEKPKVVIPKQLASKLSSRQIEHILRHEYGHLHNNDDSTGLALRAMLVINWFNPFAHFLFAQWSRCIELRSDQYATASYSNTHRKEYAETLLRALQLTANRVRQYPVASFSTKPFLNGYFFDNPLINNRLRNEKMRIKSILHGHAPTSNRARHKAALISAICLIGSASSTLLSVNAEPTQQSNLISDSQQLIMSGRLTAKYGLSPHPLKKGQQRNHKGIDIAAPIGEAIYAPDDGIVMHATDLYKGKPKYGKVVVLKTRNANGEESIHSLFAHLDSYSVEKGQKVKAGQLIARVGNTGVSTGPHVHVEIHANGERLDPLTLWQFAE